MRASAARGLSRSHSHGWCAAMYSGASFLEWLRGSSADEMEVGTGDKFNRDALEAVVEEAKSAASTTCATVFPLMYTSVALNSAARLKALGIDLTAVLEGANGHALLGVLAGLEGRVSAEASTMALTQATTLLSQVEHAFTASSAQVPRAPTLSRPR